MGAGATQRYALAAFAPVIDREVAEYWRDNYDLLYILKTNWRTLGRKVVDRLHIYEDIASHALRQMPDERTAPWWRY